MIGVTQIFTLRSQSSGFCNLNLSRTNLTYDLSWLDHPPSPSSHLQILMSSANIAIHRRSCLMAVVLDLQQTSPPSCCSHGDLSALLCQHRAILLLWYMLQYLCCIIQFLLVFTCTARSFIAPSSRWNAACPTCSESQYFHRFSSLLLPRSQLFPALCSLTSWFSPI